MRASGFPTHCHVPPGPPQFAPSVTEFGFCVQQLLYVYDYGTPEPPLSTPGSENCPDSVSMGLSRDVQLSIVSNLQVVSLSGRRFDPTEWFGKERRRSFPSKTSWAPVFGLLHLLSVSVPTGRLPSSALSFALPVLLTLLSLSLFSSSISIFDLQPVYFS
ncbi:hypothetical protein SODALDRAFT_355581 [Sodiomyces alkalinus F11]|uniref:Uncharacterized protein n=1 Tax=Sodiomyces alkalinus (strain CBS 110278 / VKM F-3762 / F11) TaxID=1314773 RepID=A0A3N2Q9D9_SODAK|nr:hypothetical protein SODALDRAFT_355581 [Sodiomyces alkalinus F11]ROT43379.1 hypothetical protein SODALDRAFT_355581 [Sodiomyces alkalinus F11]